MLCVVSPVFQLLLELLLDVNTTLSPAQNVSGPDAVITGTCGNAFTVTVTGAEPEEQLDAFVTVTMYVPPVVTTILCVVSPVFHKLLKAELEESTTESPIQKVIGPAAVITGVAGFTFTFTVVLADCELQPKLLVTVTK